MSDRPVTADKTSSDHSGSKADRSSSRSRILIVDDNRDCALSLSIWLRLKGFDTRVAHDGMAAFESAEEYRPEIVLLDIGLPNLDGFEVCRRLRATAWGRPMRVIALTGWGDDDVKRSTADAGFDAHLVKPIDLEDLLEMLSTTGNAALESR